MKTRINPKSLILYLTKRCDSRCPNCIWMLRNSNFFHSDPNLDMPVKKAKEIIDYYYDIGVRTIRLQAEGEILLYEHLKELILYCKEKGFNKQGFDLPTNGIALGEYIEFVLDYFSDIVISVDGYDAKTFIRYRGGNESVFNKIISNIKHLSLSKNKRNSNINIWINCIINHDDYEKVFPMIKLAEEIGVDKIRFGNFHPIKGGNGFRPASTAQIKYLHKEIDKSKYKVSVKLPRLHVKYPFHCSMLFEVALVGSEYSFTPCCRIDSNPYWGVFSDNRKHNSKNLCKIRKRFIKAKRLTDLPEVCRQCPRLKTRR